MNSTKSAVSERNNIDRKRANEAAFSLLRRGFVKMQSTLRDDVRELLLIPGGKRAKERERPILVLAPFEKAISISATCLGTK